MESGGSSQEGAKEDSESLTNAASVEIVVRYIKKLVHLVTEADDDSAVSSDLDVAFSDRTNLTVVSKFITEPQTHAISVQRTLLKDDLEERESRSPSEDSATSGAASSGRFKFYIDLGVGYRGSQATAVALVKRGPVIEGDKSLHSQLSVVNLSEDSPFETLHSYVRDVVAPFFKSFVQTSGKADRDGDKMVPSVQKNISELEIGLLHLQQNIDIPEITLVVHPVVQQVMKKAKDEGRKPKVQDFGDMVEDSTFLNALQKDVNRWIREIQKVTKLERDPSSGTAMQEISFWLNLERALYRIQEKREGIDIQLTLDILKHGKRFHATVSFDSDTGLQTALARVKDSGLLMKEFPLQDLLAATDLKQIQSAVVAIFTHLKKIRNTQYSVSRALKLIEAISRDLASQLLKVLSSWRLVHMSFEEFGKILTECSNVFQAWDEEHEKLINLLRDLVRKKRDDSVKMLWRSQLHHRKLQTRLEHLQRFRKQHNQLCHVIRRVLAPTADAARDAAADLEATPGANLEDPADVNAIDDVEAAYESVKSVSPLDISKEGSEAWDGAIRQYEERIDRVETRITARLRDQLGTAKNANEMFRIFSRYNALFVRPHIRGAIREYQTQLIQRVKDDIEQLHNKFKIQYPNTSAYDMSKLRDLPPVSGSIIWARQIDRQLTMYLKRVEDVLGKGWEGHLEGQQLKQDGESFRQKLNTQQVYEEWIHKVSQRQLGVSGRIFSVVAQRGRPGQKSQQLRLVVNFQPEIITLAKEVRNLKWLGFRVPLAIVSKAHQANQQYPFAISLMESVRTYERTCEKIQEHSTIAPLIARHKKDVQGLIQEGMGVSWESFKLNPYVEKLADCVITFQEKVDSLLVSEDHVQRELRALDTCQYKSSTFGDILGRIQKTVDELNLHSYSNLSQWVATLDKRIEERLAVRLQACIARWTERLLMFVSRGTLVHESLADTDTTVSEAVVYKPGGDPDFSTIRHEIHIKNQVLFLDPPIEEAQYQLLRQFQAWINTVCLQTRIQSARYQVGLALEYEERELTYRKRLGRQEKIVQAMTGAFDAVLGLVKRVAEYVKVWLQYQSLWDMQPGHVYNRLSDDLIKWQSLVQSVRKSRTTFDTSEREKRFGPIVVSYELVQAKVNLKYDSWHKDILARFGQKLGGSMTDFHGSVSKSRTELEQQSIEGASTTEAVSYITYVQGLKRKTKFWEKQVEAFRSGQKLLEKQRYQFPHNWVYTEQVDGEWGAFNDIMTRKEIAIQNQMGTLQGKITQEDEQVEQRTVELLAEWEKGKPVQGSMRSDVALSSLATFEAKFQRIKDERDNVARAREALELPDTGIITGTDEKMAVALEELEDLKGVWSELGKIWTQIDELKDQQWLTVAPRKLRGSLEGLLNQLRNLPTRLRQYASYEYVQKTLKNYMKANILIIELKSDNLRDRHWKQLCRRLRVSWVPSDLTLGQVWDVDLVKNEGIVKDVILVAQGEMGLEEFLKEVREVWQTFELDLINYQMKCKLIRGWDDLFTKVKEHINSVGAMKNSLYYKVFEEDALSWEDKLNRILALFDVWIDVQRRWVYLDGIFSGSADIKHLLPIETSRFSSISQEFLAMMKKVAKSPLVIDVLNIPGVQRSLERLADLLGKIQKALGEYLERERASFPRFYFVGDEDLLEIIGNSKNVGRLQKHFKKMFAGVHSVILNEDASSVLGVSSKEGETVNFKLPVPTADRKINEWLTHVEREVSLTLARLLAQSVKDVTEFGGGSVDQNLYMKWVDSYQAQLVVLSAQIAWSQSVEAGLVAIQERGDRSKMQGALATVESTLNVLADSVLQEQPPVRRRKLEHLITELVHQRDVVRMLINNGISSAKDFSWLSQMRFYFDPNQSDVLQQLSIRMANARFNYGFEYLGVQDKLVQTPLTDRCYLTMTQALEERLGGSPFGPAGTGKTESVKALGHQLGRFVLVFNCDERFDFQAVGRIFVGLCQVGAWGCFDEFNRLEERILSAVSQQIQTIQEALKAHGKSDAPIAAESPIKVELIGKDVKISTDMAIFITMNPGYAGRSNLPDNLKKLFRSLAMTKPDRQLIAEVMLYSQGFRTAERLASKVVPFFNLCDEQLSSQSHYDFGLRALKSVLVSAGNIKRMHIQAVMEKGTDPSQVADDVAEQEILIQSVCETMVPKLVAEDIPLLRSLLTDVFPGIAWNAAEMRALRNEVKKVCTERHLMYGEGDETGSGWVDKVLQLYQIAQLSHGLMMVGPSGSGKTTAWSVLLKALVELEGTEGVAHVIDAKSMSKEDLYGVLDPNTREWTDGLFTHILRKIIDNVRGELTKRQWIIFDGDVDPEWVENLNSVLDDNKLLTLPNGERLSLPPNVRIMFEVQDLKYATLATVSRCGMVWFSEDVVTTEMMFSNYLRRLRNVPLDDMEEDVGFPKPTQPGQEELISSTLQAQRDCASILSPHFTSDGLVVKALQFAATGMDHIMDFTRSRALGSLYSMLNQTVRDVHIYNMAHSDFPMKHDHMEKFVLRRLVYCLLWSLSGDSKLQSRSDLGTFIRGITTIPLPSTTAIPIIDFEVTVNGEWSPWQAKVPQIEVETHKVGAPDVVIPTIDTVRHESLLNVWLAEHKPLVLCGPPGSGKTMTLFSALRSLSDMEVVGLNFSSATTPELLLKTLDHYCEYRRTPNGLVLSPAQIGKWLVLFCDEINLPDMDKYGTQRVISFLRQIVERGGFYRVSDQTWVKLERVQFVGACNAPTDPGRKPLSHRFLRHVPVVYVDYPGRMSLTQIYGTFNRAMLRMVPSLRQYAEPLTDSMVDFYSKSQERFTQDMQPHYIYSPREMTRWVRGIAEALKPLETLSIEGLVRIWAHEGLRLFQDRLVYDEERHWTDEQLVQTAMTFFPNMNKDEALKRPILFSNWLSKDYMPVDQEELRDYVKARLKVFYEEELDVPLVLFNEVLDHVLRIDRIFRQPQGHLLLIGVSGAGKTTLSRFVAWINGLKVYQIKVHNKYTAADFDEDLRGVLRRAGCRDEKIAFIMDESNVLDSGFLERINTLLANGEVPGLFEGDEFSTLMTQCKEGSQRDGLMLDSAEELYKWFTNQVMNNLHVVFTMNPSTEGLKSRAATSPALFNRCVLNWFGDWSNHALFQVGREFTQKLDLENSFYIPPDYLPVVYEELSRPPTYREVIVNAFVFVHKTLHQANERLAKRGGGTMAITPRHYLDFINHYVKLFHEKRADLEEQQLHLNVGLQKIRETVDNVEELQKSLSVKKRELEEKNTLANQKLKQMVKDQQEAERKKATSQEIQEQLKVKTKVIEEKKKVVLDDLAKVEPAVEDAKSAVKSIRKQHLVEMRSMANPPRLVKFTLESICLLLKEPCSDWKTIRSTIMKDNFISSVVNFSTEDITEDLRARMRKQYLSDPDYNFETVNHASKACGPLVKWSVAQINYADMLNRVDPLRNELQSLEDEATATRQKGEEVDLMIAELEKSIAKYKEEYAVLISDAQAIKQDLAHVEAKVNRSRALLNSLANERERWEQGSEQFKTQMSTIVGDVLLSSAFMAYGGYFDQQFRHSLFTKWQSQLQQSNIQFKSDLALTEYLSNADERLRWQANALPKDDLCTENAIMLKRFNRYPLVIDPSGQATDFIVNEYRDRKISRTSFLDDAFRKNLESALRFGNPLIVQDVENYDPILNPVLNREVRRTAGRVLVTLGDQDIDLSPSFMIFLSTRDPSVEFPPDLCSRVTFVNFTVTPSSLQSQCLNQVLRAERPDVDEKRSDLLKLQGEFRLRLRHLEQSLLQALNDAKGNILDNDDIFTHLETLKKEAAEVTRKVEETDIVMAEVEAVSAQYRPLAQACSSVYFTLESLNQVYFLYQFSLQFFLDIFLCTLYKNPRLHGITDHMTRLPIILTELFQLVYSRVARGMLHHDRLTLALLLARIYLRGIGGGDEMADEFDHFLRGSESAVSTKDTEDIAGLSREQVLAVERLSRLPAFVQLRDHLIQSEEYLVWLETVAAESNIPQLWAVDKPLSPAKKAMYQLLVVQALRPDRLLAMTAVFVTSVMGEKFLQDPEHELDLNSIVENEVKSSTPILLCSVPGFDASDRVGDLATQQGKYLTAIAIGSAEGFSEADKAILAASKSGRWVMLKNVHLAPQWLVQLEKKLHSLTPHSSFRLFLTLEINPKVPVNLLRTSRILVFEPPPGIKANLIRTFSAVPAARMNKEPSERARLYFLLAWLHAIVQERLRYVPLGWSKKYEFNEPDLKMGCDTLDTWIENVAQGRTNVPPNKVPWDAFKTLLSQCIYGGRIDNDFDQRLLTSFVHRLFTVESFEHDFALVHNVDGSSKKIAIPDGTRREQFMDWIAQLPDNQTPSWLGLPNNAEKVLLTTRGYDMVIKLLRMQNLDLEDDVEYHADADDAARDVDGRPSWMRSLSTSTAQWLSFVPESLNPLKRTTDNIKDPLFRFYEREVNIGLRLLKDVRAGLTAVVECCDGTRKQTNELRSLISDLAKGIIPHSWRRYNVPTDLTVIQWVVDFSERVKQLQKVVKAAGAGVSELKRIHVWLGGLFIPEAFITATRQYVAQANNWSLEELQLQVQVSDPSGPPLQIDDRSFPVVGLKVEGTRCIHNKLELTATISTDLPLTNLKWIRVDAPAAKAIASVVTLPVYRNRTRAELLFTLDFEPAAATGKDAHSFYERGVGLLCSGLG